MPNILAETQSFRLESEFEDVWLHNKMTGKKIFAGDHYGNAEFGLISELNGWAVSGGEGVIFCDSSGHLSVAFRQPQRDPLATQTNFDTETDRVWLHDAMRNGNQPGFVSALKHFGTDEVEIELDPLSSLNSKWRLDVSRMSLRKL